ncbi:hypothetical protein SDC9_148522 [bioreactor metagenome]|uniref:Uncharacterized protein n=1 Tax=bioreactor metagenome TaxID=1076179 RepID=A0A645EL98_9ZZZZ
MPGKALQLAAHVFHAEKKESETDYGHAPAVEYRPGEKAQCQTDHDRRHDDPADFKSNQLRGDGRPDIGPEDNADGTGKIEQPGIDKTDHHHRAGAGGLNHGGYDRAR